MELRPSPVGKVRTQMTAFSKEPFIIQENPVNTAFGVDEEGSECVCLNGEWHVIEKHKYLHLAINKT